MSAADWIAERACIEQAATDGPWVREWSTPDQWWIIHGQPNPAKGDDRMVCPEVATLNHREDWTADAEFIAAARDDVPRLLAEVRRRMATEQRVREYARHLARPFAPSVRTCRKFRQVDGVPDREGEQIASELLAALDGGE